MIMNNRYYLYPTLPLADYISITNKNGLIIDLITVLLHLLSHLQSVPYFDSSREMFLRKVTIAAIFICKLTLVSETLMSNNQAIFHFAINSLNAISENCSDKSTEIMKTYSLAISDLTSIYYQQNEKIMELKVENVHLKDEIGFLKEELSKNGENLHFRIKREPRLAEYKEWPGFPSPYRKRIKQEPDDISTLRRFGDFKGQNNRKKLIQDQEGVNINNLLEVPYALQSMYRNDLEDYWDQRKHDEIEEIPNSLIHEKNQGYRERHQPYLKPKGEENPIIIIRPRNQIPIDAENEMKEPGKNKVPQKPDEVRINFLLPVEDQTQDSPKKRKIQHKSQCKIREQHAKVTTMKAPSSGIQRSNKKFQIQQKLPEVNINYLGPMQVEEPTTCAGDPSVHINFLENKGEKRRKEVITSTLEPVENEEQKTCVEDSLMNVNVLEPSEKEKPREPEVNINFLEPKKPREPEVNINFLELKNPREPEVNINFLELKEQKTTTETSHHDLKSLLHSPHEKNKIHIHYIGVEEDSLDEDMPNYWVYPQNGQDSLHDLQDDLDYEDEEMVLDSLPDGSWNSPVEVPERKIENFQKPVVSIPEDEIPRRKEEKIPGDEIPINPGGMAPGDGILGTSGGMIPGSPSFGNPWGMPFTTFIFFPQFYLFPTQLKLDLTPVVTDQCQREDIGKRHKDQMNEDRDSKDLAYPKDSICNCTPCNEIITPRSVKTVQPECKHFDERNSLYKVIKMGCSNLVGEIINKINVNETNEEGITALHIAAKRGYTDVMNILIKAGADINAVDNNNNTALHYCATGGSANACSLLLSEGCNVNVQNMDKATALHIAVWKGNYEIVRMLLKYNSSFEITDKFCRSALDLANEMNYEDIVELVEKSGVKSKNPLKMQNICGRYPFNQSAISDALTSCASFDSSSQSETEVPITKITINKPDQLRKFNNPATKSPETSKEIRKRLTDKEQELFDSSKVSDMLGSRVTKLCVEGLNVNVVDIDSKSFTPLHVAATVGVKLTTLLLVRCGADINAQDIEGNTPLHLAIKYGKYWVANILLHSGANPFAVNNLGESPQKIAQNSTEFAIRGLFDSRILKWYKPERKLRKNEKKIHQWVQNGYYLGISKECADGIDINFKNIDDNLNSALHLAVMSASKNSEETVLTLLRCGADIHSRDGNGNTPLHLAIIHKQPDIVVALLMGNADPLVVNNDGQTSYQLGQISDEPLIKDTFTSNSYAWYMRHPIDTS